MIIGPATPGISLCLVFHNHQPVGNFDSVFEQAYQDSYRPFLDVFEKYPSLKLSLHVSGPLMEWLDEHHREYVDRLADLVARERIEILGGAFYEAILTMIPPRGVRTLAPVPLSGSSGISPKALVGPTATALSTRISMPSRLS